MDKALTDGVVFLRPLEESDAPAHLAGEDEAIATYLSGGLSTEETVRAYIEESRKQWETGGPRRAFGVFDCASGRLIGSVEANLSLSILSAGQVNISYGVFKPWRGRGIAPRTLRMICEYLRAATEARQAVVRTVPGNHASARAAEKAGFRFDGLRDEGGTAMKVYSLDLRECPNSG